MSDAEDFWNHAVSVYDRTRETCLALQDDLGFEVNLLLFCCWRGSLGSGLDAAALSRIVDACADWRGNVVGPLRGARRWLKNRSAPEGAEDLRRRILELELESERMLQGLIVDAAGPAVRRPGIDTAGARRIAEENLTLYRNLVEGDGPRGGGTDNAGLLIQRLLSGVFAEDAVAGIVSATSGAVGAPD